MRRFEAHRALSQPSDGLLMGAVGDLALKTALMALQAPLAEVVEHNLPLLAKLLGASGMYLLESSGENARFRCMRSWPETLGQDLGLSQTFLGREALTDLRRGKPLVYEREATTGAFVEAGLNVLPFSSVTIVGLNSSAKLLGLLVACFPDREAQPAGLSSMLSTYGQSLSALFENQIPKGYHGLLPKALEEAGDMVLIAEAAAEKSGEPRIVYANNSFTSATGYSASELKGETLRLLHGPKTDTAAVEKIYRALSAGQAAGAELLCYRRDGSEFWTELELRPLRTGGGAPSHWVCTLRDVTRRKVEEVRLRRSEARFRSLVEHASGVIWIVDREGRIRYAGDSLRRELGYEPSDLLGKNALSFIHTDDVPAAEQMLSRSLVRAGALERGEFRVPHADGSWRWMAVVTQNMLQKPGVGGLVMNLRDISAQRGARESLELQQADLVRAAYVRQALLEIVNDVLQCGIGDAFYQGLLERAVAAIPGAQTGSILIRDAEEGYVVAAALGFDLAELRAVRFTEEHLSRTADLDSYSPRLVTGLARLNREVLDDASAELLARAGRTDEIAVTLSVPVMVGDSLRALLTVDNFESESAFGVEAIETAALFASQVGLALQRLELQRETELRARFRQALTEVANDALADGIDQRFYQRLVERAVDVIPDADAGSVLVRQPGGRFRFVAAAGFDLGVLESVWFEADELYASGQPPEATSLRFDSVDRHTRGVLDPQRLAAIEDAGRLRDIRVALTVPIRLESELVAVLSLDNLHSSRAFCGDSRQMAEAFGTQIRVVLQRLRHQEQSERRARFHQQLSEVVGETLEEGLDAGFYPRLLERAIATVPGAEAGSILLRGKSGDFAYAASQGYALDALQQVSFEADEVKRWHADHHPVLVDFAERRQGAAETRAAVLHEHGRLGEVKSALAVPLTLQDELVAILNLESFSSEHAFDEEALEYAASFATQIAVVLQRLELQQDAERRARYQHTLARVERLLLEFAGLDAFFKPLADIILGTDDIGAERVGVYRLRSDGSFAGELFGVPADVAQTALAELRERRMLDLEAGEGPIARAGRRGELSYIPDRSREPHDARSAVGSQLLLPVFRQGGLWGVFELLSSETDAFSPAARDFLAQVGRSIELALDKQASREELQREYERLQVVSAAHARLLGARSLDEAYACAVEALVRETPATGASLLLYRPHDSTLRTVASAGTMPRRRKDVALQRDAGPAWKIFDARRTLQLHGRVGQAGVGPSGSNAGESGANVLGSPLQDDAGQVVGVLLAQVPQGERFSPGDTSFVEAISQACTSAIIRLNLLERSEKEAEAYRSLAQFGATIEEINEADQLIDLGLRRLQEQLGFDCAHYHRLRSGMLEVVTVTGYEDKELLEEWQKRPLALGEGLIGQAALSGEMAYVPAYRDWEHRLASTHQDISTALAIPVRRGDQVVSVVALHCVGAVRPMRKEQLSIARNFVKRLENALERADALHEVSATRESTFRSLGVMLEYRDFETKGHTDRVVELSLQLGRKLGFDREQLRALRWGAYLHDIGKIAIPDQILLKPGRLETQEFEIIRRHTVIGTEMCRNIPFLPTETRQIVRSHHERWDGGGYPDALMGNEVPLMARIFAIIDVYDALASARPYKEAWSREAAVTEILAQAGRQFDPELVPVFVELVMQRREPEL